MGLIIGYTAKEKISEFIDIVIETILKWKGREERLKPKWTAHQWPWDTTSFLYINR